MNRAEAKVRIQQEVAKALRIEPRQVAVEWDHKHDKPKVGIRLGPMMLGRDDLSAKAVHRVLEGLLSSSLRAPAEALRESVSDDELTARLRSARDRAR